MRAGLLMLPLLLAACQDEPTFDDRFDKAAKEIDARARAMDADIAAADKAAREAGEGEPKRLPAGPPPATAPQSSGE